MRIYKVIAKEPKNGYTNDVIFKFEEYRNAIALLDTIYRYNTMPLIAEISVIEVADKAEDKEAEDEEAEDDTF